MIATMERLTIDPSIITPHVARMNNFPCVNTLDCTSVKISVPDGITPVKSYRMAKIMVNNFSAITIPAKKINR